MLERRDRSSYYDSLNAKAKSAQNEATAENAMTRAKNSTVMERRSIERNRQNIQAGLNIAGAIKGMISDAFTVGTGDLSPIVGEQLNAIIHQGQMADADTDLLSIVTEGKGLAESSIADGSSTFTMVTDENGKQQLQFTPAQSVTDWYEGAMKQIDDSSYLPDVKAAMKKSLNANYYSMVQGMQSSAIERSYQSIQAGFETKINANLVSDSQMLAQYDGKLPEGVHLSGLATILSRSDWTDEEKANYAASYIQLADKQGIMERATMIATGRASFVGEDGKAATGLDAAYQYIYSQDSLSSDDKRSFYSKASVSYNQLEGAYKTEADTMMASAFTDPGGSTPKEVYDWWENTVAANHLPDSIAKSGNDTLKSTQRKGVQELGQNTLQQDLNDGYEATVDGLEYLESGEADAWYYGMPEEKEALIGKYKAEIASIQEDMAEYLGTTSGTISSADNKIVSAFKKQMDDLENRVTLGAITGREAMMELDSIVPAYQSMLGTSAGHNELIAAKRKFISDNFDKLPAAIKTEAQGAFDSFMLSTGVDIDSKDLTPEQKKGVDEAENYYLGMLSDLIFEAGQGNVSAADFTALAQKTNEGYLLSAKLVDSEGATKAVLATDEGAISSANKKNLDIVDRIWRDGRPDSLVYLDDLAGYENVTAYDEETGTVSEVSKDPTRRPVAVFFNPGVQQTYETISQHFKPQLSDATGVPVDKISYSPYVFTDTSEAMPLPMYTVSNDDGTMDNYIVQDGYFKKWNAEANEWDEKLGYKIQRSGDTPKPVDPESGVGQGTPKQLVEGDQSSDYTKYIHIGHGTVTVDPEIIDIPGFDMQAVLDLVDKDSAYSRYRDLIRDKLYGYWNNRQLMSAMEER